jgi:hypothetical protein
MSQLITYENVPFMQRNLLIMSEPLDMLEPQMAVLLNLFASGHLLGF